MRGVHILSRWTILGAVICAGLPAQLVAQDPTVCRDTAANCVGFDRYRLVPNNSPAYQPQMIRASGRPVVPVFEGWFQNPDSSYTLSFGYISFNLEEDLLIPVGPDNFLEPAQLNGQQPTYFRPIHRVIRRPWNVFMVRVPKDFGDQRVTWTLRNHGETYTVPGHITVPGYIVETPVAPARAVSANAGAYAPKMRLDPNAPWSHGLTGARSTMSARVGRPLEIPVYVNAGETINERAREASWLWWMLYSGPARVEFSEDEVEIPLTNLEGVGRTQVTFSEPGQYVLLVNSIETLRNSFEYHCCWTNGWVTVNVTN
ncbi:MAG: hypothetical protein FJ207_05835 [Gemmatimonadetes bacterium]|nr:hypothetical protein [Gemmatimonadota bacterium]